MKKIAILGFIFFMISSQIFADENLDKFRNMNFGWQLFNYQSNNQNIDFINLNPMFFSNSNKYLSINYLGNISQNNNSQNNRNIRSNSQENNLSLVGTIFGAMMYTGAIFASSSMNRQERNTYNDVWKQQEEMERFYQRIYQNK